MTYRFGAFFVAGLILAALALPAATPADSPPKNDQQKPATHDPTPAQRQRIDQLLAVIELEPTGVFVNNQGAVAVPPGHRPYNPDGSRNQDFKVVHSGKDGVPAVVLDHQKKREAAVNELIKIGPSAVEQVVHALMTEDKKYRHLYAYVLGEIGDPRAVPALLKYFEDGRMMLTMANAYRKMGDPQMADQLEMQGTGMMADATGALQSITSEKYGPDYPKWAAWWEANKERVGPTPRLEQFTANPQ